MPFDRLFKRIEDLRSFLGSLSQEQLNKLAIKIVIPTCIIQTIEVRALNAVLLNRKNLKAAITHRMPCISLPDIN